MYGEDIRNLVEDISEKGKMGIVRKTAMQNQLHEMSKYDAGMTQTTIYLITVVLVRKLGPHWRMITFTLLLYELVPHTIKCTTSTDLPNNSVKNRQREGIVNIHDPS